MLTRLFEILTFIALILVINYYVKNFYEIGPIGQKGEKGNEGPRGYKGSIGFKGEKGDIGDIGKKGDDNFNAGKGPRGKSGLRGEQGPQGDRGNRGDRGFKGNKGEQGDVGVNGAQGESGETGDKGDTHEDNVLDYFLNTENGSGYEKEVQLETDNSIYFDDYFIPMAGTKPSLGENDSSFTVHRLGIPLAEYGGINDNLTWDKFVTGYRLKGVSTTDDRARGYYTNIKIKNFGKI